MIIIIRYRSLFHQQRPFPSERPGRLIVVWKVNVWSYGGDGVFLRWRELTGHLRFFDVWRPYQLTNWKGLMCVFVCVCVGSTKTRRIRKSKDLSEWFGPRKTDIRPKQLEPKGTLKVATNERPEIEGPYGRKGEVGFETWPGRRRVTSPDVLVPLSPNESEGQERAVFEGWR